MLEFLAFRVHLFEPLLIEQFSVSWTLILKNFVIEIDMKLYGTFYLHYITCIGNSLTIMTQFRVGFNSIYTASVDAWFWLIDGWFCSVDGWFWLVGFGWLILEVDVLCLRKIGGCDRFIIGLFECGMLLGVRWMWLDAVHVVEMRLWLIIHTAAGIAVNLLEHTGKNMISQVI